MLGSRLGCRTYEKQRVLFWRAARRAPFSRQTNAAHDRAARDFRPPLLLPSQVRRRSSATSDTRYASIRSVAVRAAGAKRTSVPTVRCLGEQRGTAGRSAARTRRKKKRCSSAAQRKGHDTLNCTEKYSTYPVDPALVPHQNSTWRASRLASLSKIRFLITTLFFVSSSI